MITGAQRFLIDHKQKGFFMNDYILTCCSTADESRSFFEERDIEVIFFRYVS